MLETRELDYDLPERAIAVVPAEPRESAKLMVVPRSPGEVAHRTVRDLPGFLRAGDVLVVNTTRVAPARFVGVRADTGGRAEGLFLREAPAGPGALRWVAMIRTKRARAGVRLALHREAGEATGVELALVEPLAQEPGAWVVDVLGAAGRPTALVLDDVGRTPLPPYIVAARAHAGLAVPDAEDRARYQTCMAASGASVAAPTAGLHLTPALLAQLESSGVRIALVELEVGPGTFKPVEVDTVESHPMHEERCRMSPAVRDTILHARASGGRVVCVGTTSCRTVEAMAALDEAGAWHEGWHATRLLITPGYAWRWTDGLMTNFHLPRSTLMALVAAMLQGGAPALRSLYARALEAGYRFYSYGDAMLVLPK